MNKNKINKKEKQNLTLRRDANLVSDLFSEDLKKIPTRDGFGEGLVALGEKDKNIVVLCADLSESTRALNFKEKFPANFVQVGVAEQNLAGLAAGMEAAGKIPFITSYAMFSPGRNWEQIRTTIAYSGRNVKIAGAHSGISVGPDGATHQALEDIAITRVLPRMTVVVPCDYTETRKATIAIGKMKGPAYIRFAREKTPSFTTKETPFVIGKAQVFLDGKDVCIIGCGPILHEALKAASELKKQKISAGVINCHTIKPLDFKTIISAAKKYKAIVTVEEHQYYGGLGGAISELLSETYPVPIKRIGVKDRFGESGAPDELLKKFNLASKDIEKAAKEAIKMRRR